MERESIPQSVEETPESEGRKERPEVICDRCGSRMIEANCKVVCPNCGNRLDCSDLSLYLD